MASRTAGPEITDPDATEFVRFCYRRRRVGWPELYDEMCAVAARGTFRGMGPDELGGLGIGFSLFDMPALAVLSTRVIAEEQAKRRPVAVAIVAEPVAFEIEVAALADVDVALAVTDTPVPAEIPVATELAVVNTPIERSTERAEIDVPIRLSPVPAGA
jgi:hypothetical protein